MRTINTDLIEKILLINDKFLKFAREFIFDGSDITPTQFNILWEIILHKELSVNDLKQKLIISSPALSQLLNRMEKSLLIERSLGKTDKREIKLKPTKKAITLYAELNKKYIKLAWEKLWNIKDTDKEIILKILEWIEKVV